MLYSEWPWTSVVPQASVAIVALPTWNVAIDPSVCVVVWPYGEVATATGPWLCGRVATSWLPGEIEGKPRRYGAMVVRQRSVAQCWSLAPTCSHNSCGHSQRCDVVVRQRPFWPTQWHQCCLGARSPIGPLNVGVLVETCRRWWTHCGATVLVVWLMQQWWWAAGSGMLTCREITLDGLYNTSKSFLGASGVAFDHVAGWHHHHSAVKHVPSK